MQLNFTFSGSVGELIDLLERIPSGIQVECKSLPTLTLEDRAIAAAAPFAKSSQKIEAIKAWRAVTNATLANALAAVEKHFPETRREY